MPDLTDAERDAIEERWNCATENVGSLVAQYESAQDIPTLLARLAEVEGHYARALHMIDKMSDASGAAARRLSEVEDDHAKLGQRYVRVMAQRDALSAANFRLSRTNGDPAEMERAAKAWRLLVAGSIPGSHERPLASAVDALPDGPPAPLVSPLSPSQPELVPDSTDGIGEQGEAPLPWHVGRAWAGHDIEDTCPCPQEPCGLVEFAKADPSCEHHPASRARSIRQSHRAADCPGPSEADWKAMYDTHFPGDGDDDQPMPGTCRTCDMFSSSDTVCTSCGVPLGPGRFNGPEGVSGRTGAAMDETFAKAFAGESVDAPPLTAADIAVTSEQIRAANPNRAIAEKIRDEVAAEHGLPSYDLPISAVATYIVGEKGPETVTKEWLDAAHEAGKRFAPASLAMDLTAEQIRTASPNPAVDVEKLQAEIAAAVLANDRQMADQPQRAEIADSAVEQQEAAAGRVPCDQTMPGATWCRCNLDADHDGPHSGGGYEWGVGIDFGCPKCQTILNAKAANCDGPWHADNAPADPPWLEEAIMAAAKVICEDWSNIEASPARRGIYRSASLVLRAALPHITRGVLTGAANKVAAERDGERGDYADGISCAENLLRNLARAARQVTS